VSVRFRLTLVALVATAAVFALGSFLFSSLLASSLVGTLDANLAAQATQALQSVPGPGGQENLQDAGGAPVGTKTARASVVPSEYLLQVLAPGGRVVQANQAASNVALLTLAEARDATTGRLRLTVARARDGGQLRLLAVPVDGQRGWVVVVGASLATVDETLHNVNLALVVAGLVGVALAGLAAYLLARAALAPVEAMRREVETLADLERPQGVGIEVPSTRDELARLGETMNHLLARLSDSLVRLSEALARERSFVADAGHELRTPLAVLKGELELASRSGRTRAELASAVKGALGEADHVARLAEDLLVLAQQGSGKLSLFPDKVQVDELLLRRAAAVHAVASRAHARVVVDADAGLEALVDAGRLRQVVDNLLDNALRYAPASSTITVSARARDATLVISVADEGPGFPPAFLPRAFERFARSDAARGRETGGTGLGLAIVAAIAAAHGGWAEAANAPGGGAVVTVEIPDTVIQRSTTSE
jgi:two-component system OmpR family sensor kinase